jgi:hypothetical protein
MWSNTEDKKRGFVRSPGGDETTAVVAATFSLRAVTRFP